MNGELWELGRPIEADCELELLGYDTAEGRQVKFAGSNMKRIPLQQRWLLGFCMIIICPFPSLSCFLSQAAWRTGACVLSGVLETGFGAEVCREGASEFGLYCDHVLSNR